MRPVIVRSLVVITAGVAVLIGLLYVASTVDARAPEVAGFELTQALPGDPDTALSTTSLEITFNEEVQVDPGTEPLAVSPPVEGTVSWAGSTMTFTPHDPLALETEYTATVGTGIRDLAGNRIQDGPPTFVFRTAGRPSVAATDPVDGATEVPIEEPIRITFSTLMDTGSVEAALSVQPDFDFDLAWAGDELEIVPLDPLEADQEYEVRIGSEAADVAGVRMAAAVSLSFRTVAPGLVALTRIPTDGVEGIAPTSPIAVIFDRALDPESVSAEALVIDPEVAGSLAVVSAPGAAATDDEGGEGVVLRFVPSDPLPLNTTFEVRLAPGLRSLEGGAMAQSLTWSFTTGAPAATLSNQVVFVSDRSGVANVWAMNTDGSSQGQVTAELTPVVDYALAPDGSRLVIADGRTLISMRPDGTARTVLTDDRYLEFDPAFSPNGQRLAFGRADAESGAGLGLWIANADGGDPVQVELPPQIGTSPTPSPSGEVADDVWLRAPRFSPDGQALAFVDPEGAVVILELPALRLTRFALDFPVSAPEWLPGSSAVLVAGHPDAGEAFGAPDSDGRVLPLAAPSPEGTSLWLASRSGTSLRPTELPDDASLVAVARDGRLAIVDGDAQLLLADGPESAPRPVSGLGQVAVSDAAFAPGEAAMVIVTRGRLELLELATGQRTPLAPDGRLPAWLP